MTVHPEDRQALRRYLLGELADEEAARRLDARLLADDLFFEELEVAEDELIEDYLAGALSPTEREKFKTHFLTTAERSEKLDFARALRRRVAQHAPSPSLFVRFAPFWKAAAAALLLLGGGLIVWRLFIYQSDLERGEKLLAEAHRDRRSVESRVSGLPHAPLVVTRGAEPAPADGARRHAELTLRNALDEAPGPAARHALGRLHLAAGQLDDAITNLEAALADDPDNARLHSDLGAAYLERGRRARAGESPGRGLEDFGRALEHLNRAHALDASLPEALFNRALTYEELMLPPQAEADWRAYLTRDPASPWADEARARLRRLEELQRQTSLTREQRFDNFLRAHRAGDEPGAWEAIDQSSQRTGNYILEHLIDEHLAAAAGGRREEADESLRMLTYVGELKARHTGDLYASEVARVYRDASPERRAILRRARESAAAGQQHITTPDFRAASAAYEEARRLFAAAGDDAEALQAEYWLAICHQQRDYAQAAAGFARLADDCPRRGFKWLAARALNGMTVHHFTAAEYSRAIETAGAALDIAEQSRDLYAAQSALSGLVDMHVYLGNFERALGHAGHALEVTTVGRAEVKQAWLIHDTVAALFNSLGLHPAAVAYQEAALRLAAEVKDFSAECVAHANLGAIHGRRREFDEGIREARRAFELAQSRRGEPDGRQLMAYAALQLGNLYRQAGDLGRAVENFDLSIEIYAGSELPVFLYYAHKGRLLARLAAHDTTGARHDLEAALRLFDRFRPQIIEESNRNSFFDAEQEVYDLAVGFEYSTMGNAERAFEYSEDSRARSLLDLVRAAPPPAGDASEPSLRATTRPLQLAEIRARLPERAQVLQYAVLPDRLLIWVASRDDFRAVEQRVTSKWLDEAVGNYRRALSAPQDGSPEAARGARALYDVLIGPAEPLLSKDKQLYVVPDKALGLVPFGSLVSPATGRHLIEDYAVASAPSSTMLVVAAEAARARGGPAAAERLLCVGDPRLDPAKFAGLPALPAASREAAEVAALYQAPQLLTGGRATEAEVARRMPGAEVIHFAAHSVPEELAPLRSRLLLAAGGGAGPAADGVLHAAEIYRLRLPRTKLVVLSACQTAAGRALRGEGVLSMARPFLAAHVPQVVASLWAVDSEATAELMVAFHRHRRTGLQAAEALRRAQLELLRGPREAYRHPFYWASFTLVGADADF